MNIQALSSTRSKIQSIQAKVVVAILLSILYSSILAYIIYGTLNYPLAHQIYDLSYAFVYFLLLYEGYWYVVKWQEKHFPFVKGLYQRYLLGLVSFVVFGFLLWTIVALLPFLMFMQPIGGIDFGAELRLNYIINILFCSVYFLCLTGFNALKNYHEASLNAEILKKEIAQAQYEGLKNQVNPHFLFNSLNVLSTLVHVDANLSEQFIDKLAKAYRYVLEQQGEELVTLKTEVDFINSYIFLLKIRFEEKLQININLPADALNCYIPPLTIQLLIENAVKHNILSSETPLVVDLYVDDEEYLVIKNNVQLRPQEFASTGVGLKNITNRYGYFTSKHVFFRLSGPHYIARVPLLC
jgi:two-component system, LytTR family, sensor kinase